MSSKAYLDVDVAHYETLETFIEYMKNTPDPALCEDKQNGNDANAVNSNLQTNSAKADNENDTENKAAEKPVIKTPDGKFIGEAEWQKELEQWAKEAEEWGKEHGFDENYDYEAAMERQRLERRKRKQYGRPLD